MSSLTFPSKRHVAGQPADQRDKQPVRIRRRANTSSQTVTPHQKSTAEMVAMNRERAPRKTLLATLQPDIASQRSRASCEKPSYEDEKTR